MADNSSPLKITKLDAARRQLRTAITLWFNDGDPVSIHTLAFAAHEIIHFVSKKKGRGRDLLFDSLVIRDERRKEFNILMKSHATFFKHARSDAEAVTEFHPILSRLFILFSILGVELSGEALNDEESAFIWWLFIHEPALLTEQGRKQIEDCIPVEHLRMLEGTAKHEFLEIARLARRLAGR
jgi:hypothetical protein